MTDADVFGKLSRIFETHGFGEEDDIDDLLDDFEPANDFNEGPYSPTASRRMSPFSPRRTMQSQHSRSDRPTPYEVWQEQRQKKLEQTKQLRPIPKLSSEQWDRLVSKMHQSNRDKQSAMIKEQNQGLALELGGYLFKPRINKTSLDLSATMKSLHVRMPEMQAERKKELETKRKENEEAELAQCTFTPKRVNQVVSDHYLKRSGRKKLNPEDLFKYESERRKRLELRKAIVEEIQSKELTFRPQISERSAKLHEKLASKGALKIDPVTRTAITSPHTLSYRPKQLQPTPDARYEQGPMLVIESDHPYHNNTNEYTTVCVPNAVQYIVTFHEDTRTEPVYDYVKFYADETHTDHYGVGKYSGGSNDTPSNWPGMGNRPPLIIPDRKFVIHFKTNDIGNDWGFRMNIVPVLMINSLQDSISSREGIDPPSVTAAVPVISEAGQRYRTSEPVHKRLHRKAIEKQAQDHNQMVDLMQTKLNVMLRPWEIARPTNASGMGGSFSGQAHPYIKAHSRTHMAKAPLSSFVDSLVIGGEEEFFEHSKEVAARPPLVAVVEFDDALSNLWRQLRTL